MDLETLRKIRRFSTISIEGWSTDDTESQSPPRISSLVQLEPSAQSPSEMQVSELEVLELEWQESERSRPRAFGIHSSGRKINKSRSRSPKKGSLSK
jgi:hypothetical protein